MRCTSNRFHLAAATIALAACWAQAALAQTAPSQEVEEVTVTGTSIRGAAPVGSSVTSVSEADIKATGATAVQGILNSVPQLMGLGAAGQGATGQNAQEASIHQFGNSASTSTLTLVDGHRVPLSGTNHSFVDPNLLPMNMIERVEVLADGVSAVYGSDAVAGVVNFITRKHFDGVQFNANTALMNGKTDYNLGVLTGKSWDTGSVVLAYTWMRQGWLWDIDRPYTNPNHIAQGGTNFGNFNCDPATIQPAGSALIYTSATSGQTLTNTAANSPCSQWAYGSLIPKTVRNNAMMKVEQTFGPNWTLDGEMLYAARRTTGPTARGTVTATVFQNGPQANPFYQLPAGYTGTATSETVRWDADQLLGQGATSINGGDTIYGDMNLEYRFRNWTFDLLGLLGRDDSSYGTSGTVNTSVANLGLNGTTLGNGSTTTPVVNTNIILTQLPLTAATALDVWNPAATNRTSASVIKQLTDNDFNSHVINGISQLRLQGQGELIDLPAGPVKLAFGGELYRISIFEYLSQAQNAGPASNASVYRNWHFSRNVQSAFVEALIPLVSEDMHVPFMHALNLDLSGRYDHYSDFGNTQNPKIALDWRVDDDLKLRANWSTSFVAPPVDELGADGTWNNTNYQPYPTNNISVPVNLFPLVTQMGIPGCTAASVTCNISALQGLHVTNGNPHQSPSRGHGWSMGFDYTPSYVPGLSVNFTYWATRINGGSTGPNISYISTTASLAPLMTFYPGCATPAQISAIAGNLPLTAALAPCTQYIVDTLNSSWLNLRAEGVDASVNYIIPTDSAGTFQIGDSVSTMTKFNESIGVGGAWYSVINTTGANSFPTVALQMRGNAGWSLGGFNAQLFVNYTGGYRNWSSPVNPIKTDPTTNVPVGGGDPVKANVTLDLNLAYGFNDGILGDDEVSLNVRNLLDSDPPFYNSSAGFDANVANPLGRVVTIGLQTRF